MSEVVVRRRKAEPPRYFGPEAHGLRDRFCSGHALRHAPYWRGRTTETVHLVRHVQIVWRGVGATWSRPRLEVQLWCRSLSPNTAGAAGLVRSTGGVACCPRCIAKRAAWKDER